MSEFLQSTAIQIAIGVVLGLLTLVIPFRRFPMGPPIARDVVAFVATMGFIVAGDTLLAAAPADWIVARIGAWYELVGRAPVWLIILAYIVLADFGAYWAHRAMHTRWLWSIHAWHHSTKHLNWVSGLRASPVHVVLLSLPYYVAFIILPLPETALVGLIALLVSAFNQHLIHSNVQVPYRRALELVLVTPRYHFVHHSAQPTVANSNYGFTFSVWDRLFGTYTVPERVSADDALGLDYEISDWRLMVGLPPAADARKKPDPSPTVE